MYKYLFDINYNNKVFSIFLGENNHKAFLESKNGKYFYPLYDDFLYLNDTFNKKNFVSYKVEKFNFKEKVMIKSTAVALALLTLNTASTIKSNSKSTDEDDIRESKSVIAEIIENSPHFEISENKITSKVDLDKFLGYESVTDEMLNTAIDENNQITNADKEKLKYVIVKIREKSENFDFRIFYENVKTLNIYMMDSSSMAKEYGLGVKGCYDVKKNTIFYTASSNDTYLYHEMCHVLFDYYRNDNGKVVYKFNDIGQSLGEAMNTKITNFIVQDSSYGYQCAILDFLLVNLPYSLTEYNYNGISGYKEKLAKEFPTIDIDFIFNVIDCITTSQKNYNISISLDKAPAFIEELFNFVKINPDSYPYFKIICEYVNDDVVQKYENEFENLKGIKR